MITLGPDPAPHTGTAPVTIQAYDYVTPAVSKVTHDRIPGLWFRCHVSVNGRKRCVLFRK